MLTDMLRCSAVGDRNTVAEAMGAFVAATGADELMLMSSIHDHQQRLRSFEIAATAFG